ncbi:hypothetical protein AAC387_Pa03g3126 [Persea americana]
MRNILKKLHIIPNQQSECSDGSSKGSRSVDWPPEKLSPPRLSPPSPAHRQQSEQKQSSGLSGWFSSVAARHTSSPPSSSGREKKDSVVNLGTSSLGDSDVGSDTVRRDSESSNTRDPELDEEYQIQLALELSAREDPEAAQIEAVKQISLGSFPPQNTAAEVVAYKYWNYNALNYDDKILDGFYDLYGVLAETSSEMPSLVDLQLIPVSSSVSWEAVLVNRAADADLLKLEERALVMAVESRSVSMGFKGNDLVQKLAALVADYMGGPVGDPEQMLKAWRNLSNHLRASVGNMVLSLGQLRIGLARHRALLFKVLADSVGVPCQLVKGQLFTTSDDVAMNIVKIDDGREYIVDLMADPGTLIPSDTAGPQIEYKEHSSLQNPLLREVDGSQVGSFSCGMTSSISGHSEHGLMDKRSRSGNLSTAESRSDERGSFGEFVSGDENRVVKYPQKESSPEGLKSGHSKVSSNLDLSPRPNPHMHARSPSWTEGVSSPAVHRMKVKDVSQYMIDAAKENPHLAQKLHDVLLESGVVAPPNLFTEIYSEQVLSPVLEKSPSRDMSEKKMAKHGNRHKAQPDAGLGRFLPPLPYHGMQPKGATSRVQVEQLKPVEGLGVYNPLDLGEAMGLPLSSQYEVSGAVAQTVGPSPVKFVKHVPVAAAAATAAVVASSMVVAAAKSNDSNLEVPVAAAATATAAAVVATTAAVTRQYEQLESYGQFPFGDDTVHELQGSDHGQDGVVEQEQDTSMAYQEGERTSNTSAGNDSVRSDPALDDVAEWEIPWEEITLGERIGLGSYGEVYHGDWHGTEVAVKKFLDQDISGDALEEFKSEVRIIKRLRHPNVVLFMGAVTRVPNLSLVTEFLPRGSLYRLIHRPNNQLDERKRLKMALDVARGMNYLHNCTPIIVHRDLKSPNLLVDRNWVVKVCDFGLSRMKHNTFLSSRSTAGTAEWMAPEVLRNEPSDEKCDVYSFGIILWELSTLQQPWGGMNPMQVVGAVGFQHRRLDIPDGMDPVIADIIRKCWQTDPKQRPSFAEIMAALKPLQKHTAAQVPRLRVAPPQGGEKGPSWAIQDQAGHGAVRHDG